MSQEVRRRARDGNRHGRSESRVPRIVRKRKLFFEHLEPRQLLSAATVNVADVPVWDAERQDSGGSLINYLGGNVVAEAQATVGRVTDVVHSGQGAYRMDTVGSIAPGNFAFVQMTLGAAGFSAPYVDTRDLTHYQEVSLWIRNRSGTAFTLELGIKDYPGHDRDGQPIRGTTGVFNVAWQPAIRRRRRPTILHRLWQLC